MKTRAEIKEQARTSFKRKYWPVVGIGLLGSVIVGAMGYIPVVGWLLTLLVGTIIIVGLNGFQLNVYRGNELRVEYLFSGFNRYGRVLGGMLWMFLWIFLWMLIFIIPFIVIIVIMAVSAFMSVASVTANGASLDFGMNNMMGQWGNSSPWGGMMPGWGNTDFWQGFANFSPWWLLLFLLLIPVIIKTYSYFCTPYILADSPKVPAIDALNLSKKIMNGYKGKLFVAQLSFIPWFLLQIGTFVCYVLFLIPILWLNIDFNSGSNFIDRLPIQGYPLLVWPMFITVILGILSLLLWIFYVGPYYNATMAGFYQEIKEEAKRKGIEGTQALR